MDPSSWLPLETCHEGAVYAVELDHHRTVAVFHDRTFIAVDPSDPNRLCCGRHTWAGGRVAPLEELGCVQDGQDLQPYTLYCEHCGRELIRVPGGESGALHLAHTDAAHHEIVDDTCDPAPHAEINRALLHLLVDVASHSDLDGWRQAA